MGRKLVSLETAARTARAAMVKPQGMSGDLDVLAGRIAKDKKVKATLHDGSTVWATATWVTNAGFRGIEVSLTLKDGSRRVAKLENVKIYQG